MVDLRMKTNYHQTRIALASVGGSFDMESVFFLFLVAILAVILIRVAAGAADRGRISDYVRERGRRVIRTSWAPFGTAWFGERNARIY